MYLYMFTHPGKKLNFMGNELGQLYEWSEAGTLDWALAERPFHRFPQPVQNLCGESRAARRLCAG